MQQSKTSARTRALVLTAVSVTALATLAPASAPAAKVKGTASAISFRAALGEANDVSAGESPAAGYYRIAESAITVADTTGSACIATVPANPSARDCPSASISKVRANLRNGNDHFTGAGTIPYIVNAGGGIDVVVGGAAADRLSGGRDNDAGVEVPYEGATALTPGLIGGGGPDLLRGGAGSDVIDAFGDGFNDRINCGPGNDIVYADTTDIVKADCETVLNKAAPGTPEPVAPEPPAPAPVVTNTTIVQGGTTVTGQSDDGNCRAGVRALGKSARVKRNRLALRLRAPKNATATCKGTARLDALVRRAKTARRSRLRIGSARFSLRKGQTKRVKLKLNRTGRRLIRRYRRLRVRVNVSTYHRRPNQATTSKITKKRLVIRAARRR